MSPEIFVASEEIINLLKMTIRKTYGLDLETKDFVTVMDCTPDGRAVAKGYRITLPQIAGRAWKLEGGKISVETGP